MILAINTSTPQFGIALLQGDGTALAEYSMAQSTSHFGQLMPALDFLLNTSQSQIQEIEGLAVATGPGSFTGLRVGLAAAKGVCHALGVPLVGISSLAALAVQMPLRDVLITSILDSRKGELFAAQFVWKKGEKLCRHKEDVSLRIEELPAKFDSDTLFIGNDHPRQHQILMHKLGTRVRLAPAHLWNLRASAVGYLALKRFQACDFDDPATLNPVYLRPPDIRPNPHPLLFKSPDTAGP
jgi:tRNA threonylcarbamoyladenosine biosynthesis protein TsaB